MPNRLAAEKSPYLLQHADNPVDWHPWGEEAFARAREEDKPVFLSIGYATCHWCHVMAHESFEDPEVARILNEGFVAVKVDREERPDLDSVYMTVCQALTGQGGWPLTVFLTPDKEPFYAGTYFPKSTHYGRPGMLELLPELARMWREEREKILNAGQEITQAVGQRRKSDEREPDEALMEKAYWALAKSFDERFGGFGQAPKFPTPSQLSFLIRWQAGHPEAKAWAMAGKTLTAMRLGGIFDQVGLGFHRYSVDARWLVPHFEKMLYDQALIALALLDAHAFSGEEFFAGAARDVFTYVLRDMTDPRGGFYSAEDADSEGEEGTFYLWTPEQVRQHLDDDLAGLWMAYFGITPAGNFEGKNIPNVVQDLAAFAQQRGRSADEVAQDLERARQKLFVAREERVHPLKDDKVLTAWNGLMIAALARGSVLLDQPAYLRAAQRAAGFVMATLRDESGRLMRRWRQGEAKGIGYLEDYAFLTWGLIELHQAGGDPQRLGDALELTETAIKYFWDDIGGGFFFTPHDGEDLIVREKDAFDGATPSGNSVMALNLMRLARLTGRADLEDRAGRLLRSLGTQVAQAPSAFTQYLQAADWALSPGVEVVICGDPDDPAYIELLEEYRRHFLPRGVLLLKQPGQAERVLADLAPFTEAMGLVGGRPAAYVCRNHACARPVTQACDLGPALTE